MATQNEKSALTKKPVWFITGGSTGFSRELAKHVLERGCRAVRGTKSHGGRFA